MQTLTGTTSGWRSRSLRRNLSITIWVIDSAICGSLLMAASIAARVTLTTREFRNAMIDAERGSPVNIASSPTVSPRPISPSILPAPGSFSDSARSRPERTK
jgi:hypothetical protein